MKICVASFSFTYKLVMPQPKSYILCISFNLVGQHSVRISLVGPQLVIFEYVKQKGLFLFMC